MTEFRPIPGADLSPLTDIQKSAYDVDYRQIPPAVVVNSAEVLNEPETSDASGKEYDISFESCQSIMQGLQKCALKPKQISIGINQNKDSPQQHLIHESSDSAAEDSLFKNVKEALQTIQSQKHDGSKNINSSPLITEQTLKHSKVSATFQNDNPLYDYIDPNKYSKSKTLNETNKKERYHSFSSDDSVEHRHSKRSRQRSVSPILSRKKSRHEKSPRNNTDSSTSLSVSPRRSDSDRYSYSSQDDSEDIPTNHTQPPEQEIPLNTASEETLLKAKERILRRLAEEDNFE